ncbi:MAG TPA: serine hydrolase domain-containing protein [Terriglobia bacterium]|nr:serine hydrolase domain-containing protein [Terriglobia bacterium]
MANRRVRTRDEARDSINLLILNMRIRHLISALSLALFFAVTSADAQTTSPLPEARPESVGFSAERLQRLDDAMQALVDNKQLAGIVTLIARHGKLVHQRTFGQQDLASAKPMPKDAIFRIYSMTKPITGVAMMILYEEGKWRPADPIAKYIPEFANLKVYAGDSQGDMKLDAPAHAPTVGELMSHTAGFTYGVFGNTPVDKLYQQSNPLQAASFKEFIDRVAKLPLVYQPGEGWIYSIAVDIQGYLVERISGKPFPEFLRDHIFTPLGMKDTGFAVPQDKLPRLATVYGPGANGSGLSALPNDPNVTRAPGLPSGGGGLYSTAADYLRFTQMLLNGGELNGVRILSPSSVTLMRSNHLPERLMNGKYGIGLYRMQPGLGFGYDFAVFEDPIKIGSTAGKGSYLWDGVAGTWFWIDPTNDVVFVGMIQRMLTAPGAPNVEDLSRALVYQALLDPTR